MVLNSHHVLKAPTKKTSANSKAECLLTSQDLLNVKRLNWTVLPLDPSEDALREAAGWKKKSLSACQSKQHKTNISVNIRLHPPPTAPSRSCFDICVKWGYGQILPLQAYCSYLGKSQLPGCVNVCMHVSYISMMPLVLFQHVKSVCLLLLTLGVNCQVHTPSFVLVSGGLLRLHAVEAAHLHSWRMYKGISGVSVD